MATKDRERATVDATEVEAERLPVEEWATRKGLFPQMVAPPPPPRATIAGQVDENVGRVVHNVNLSSQAGLAPRTNPNFWKFAAAKAHNSWPIGLTMTEADFDKAIVAATDGITLR